MDYGQLANFNNYDSSSMASADALSQNMLNSAKSTLQFDASQFKEKGQAFLELSGLSEAVSGLGFKAAEPFMPAVQKALSDLPGAVSDGVGSLYNTAATAAKGAVQNLSSRVADATNPVAKMNVPEEADPEFGVTDSQALSLLNGSSTRSLASNYYPYAEGDLSAMRDPILGTSRSTVSDLSTDVAPAVETAASDATVPVAEAATAATTEATGAVLDATGFGAPLGLILGVAGLAAGGWSAAKGIMDLFTHHSDTPATLPSIPDFTIPSFQAS